MNQPVWRALVESVVAAPVPLSDDEWRDCEAIISRALADRPAKVQRQVRLLLRVLDTLALVRTGRRLHALDREARDRFLDRIQNSGVSLIRRGFWGVRTLALMGYFARPAAATEIGYRAHPRGWEART